VELYSAFVFEPDEDDVQDFLLCVERILELEIPSPYGPSDSSEMSPTFDAWRREHGLSAEEAVWIESRQAPSVIALLEFVPDRHVESAARLAAESMESTSVTVAGRGAIALACLSGAQAVSPIVERAELEEGDLLMPFARALVRINTEEANAHATEMVGLVLSHALKGEAERLYPKECVGLLSPAR
jgi:hypothetical protein